MILSFRAKRRNLLQKPQHHLPEPQPEVVKEIAPGQPFQNTCHPRLDRGFLFPGLRMEGVLEIGNVAGVQAPAQQEGRVDTMTEEDGLEAQLVAGDAG